LAASRREAEKALAAAPDEPHAHYLLALIARSEGKAEEALPHLQKVLAADPKDLGANVTLGQVELQLRKVEEAAAAFRIALASEPYNVSAAYNLGVALTAPRSASRPRRRWPASRSCATVPTRRRCPRTIWSRDATPRRWPRPAQRPTRSIRRRPRSPSSRS